VQHIEFSLKSPDGLDFFFQGWQPDAPSKAVVCLVHGLGEHSGRYAHVAAALNDAGYALFGFDLRGHGKSGGQRGHTPSMEAWIDDIARLTDEAATRFTGKPRFLYGHSLGGLLVLTYSLRRKPSLAGVIASSPGLRPIFPIPAAKLAIARIASTLRPTLPIASGLEPDGISRDPEIIHTYIADPLVHDRVSARSALTGIQAGDWALAHAAEFPPVPLLLVHGTADSLTSPAATEEFAAKVPGECTLKLWEGFYHETHNEPEKAAVLAFMIDWLQQHTPE